jgi:alpha-N-arabinofuranosidase
MTAPFTCVTFRILRAVLVLTVCCKGGAGVVLETTDISGRTKPEKNMHRRGFLKTGTVATLGYLLHPRLAPASSSSDSRIDVLLDEPIGTISPNIYGHFTEHIGGVIYDGVWVGEDSRIPNSGGIRTALVEKLRQIHAPVIRWPGGCFADSYDWKDGIGKSRPKRTNFWIEEFEASRLKSNAVQIYDNNAFGTDEFLRFCRLSGAEPYLAANVRSLPALELDRWVEYCNSPAGTTTMAELRANGGSPQPYNVKYWGIGNESWGCGGSFTPQDYASEFRRYTAWIPKYGLPLEFIASGPSGNDLEWTHGFFEKTFASGDHNLTGWSIHYYAWNLSRGKSTDWVAAKGDSLQFDIVDWYELFQQGYLMEKIVEDQWAAIGQYDPQHTVKLVVDEYGPWYRKGTEVTPDSILSQQVTMRDALFTAFTLDIFNRHAEKISMAACAQLVNCINALFLAHEDKFIVTPNFHVFDLYAAHQGGVALRTEVSSRPATYIRDGQPATFWGLKGSASRKDNTLTLTVVNADVSAGRDALIALRGARIVAAKARTLSHHDIHAHNTFESPDTVGPQDRAIATSSEGLHFTFPPASVSAITVTLG